MAQSLPLPGSPEYRVWFSQQRRREHKNAPAPAAPVGLSAIPSVGYVDVTWPPQPGVVIVVYRAELDDFGSASPLQSLIDATAFVDSNTVATTDYWYWITASNGAGESFPSDSVTVTAL
jgi:hypothetical protein